MSANKIDIATAGIHGDDKIAIKPDISAPIHVSTTFAYDNDPSKLVPAAESTFSKHDMIYSRLSSTNVNRAEEVLGQIVGGNAVLYSSGLSAFHSMMIHLNPKNVFIGEGYHGCHAILDILKRNYGVKVHPLDADPAILQKGDVLHLETPVNPYGMHFDIEKYAKIAHSRGAILTVDATFAPPPLFDPFAYGADIIMHSATKYFGGHSDLLSGALVLRDDKATQSLLADRASIGTIPGSLEAWLLLRSLRTYKLRVLAQTESATKIVKYLAENKSKLPKITTIHHASLQSEDFVKKQLPHGGPPVFSIEVTDSQTARELPSKLKYFHHATSLGGVESLIEWRAMSDETVSPQLLRISVGLEDTDDLIEDLRAALA